MTSPVPIHFDPAQDSDFFIFNFYYDRKPLPDAPRCLFTLRSAGSMLFDWAVPNENRADVFRRAGISPDCVAPVKLIHSRIVYDVSPADPAAAAQLLHGFEGDGVVTSNSRIVPSVTAADCMPVYLYDTVTGARGVVHSGWKGTGIAAAAVAKMQTLYGTSPENIAAVMGPHIRDCCYCVDENRARSFAADFGSRCVRAEVAGGQTLFRLSLLAANMAVLENAGVRHIAYTDVCTCCNDRFGSFRREGASFTRAAACVF